MALQLLSLPQEILDKIYKYLTLGKRVRYTPPVTQYGATQLSAVVHPMALVTKQQSTEFIESMLKYSVVVFKHHCDLVHFIEFCRTKAFVKYITLNSNFSTWLDDLSALVVQELIPSVPHLRRLRFAIGPEVIYRLHPTAPVPAVESSAPKMIFNMIKEGELDMGDISANMLPTSQLEMPDESGKIFWAVINELDLFNPNRESTFAVELRCRVRIEYEAPMWIGRLSHVMATALFEFQHGDEIVLSMDRYKAIIVPQRPRTWPGPADELQAALLRTKTLDKQMSTLVHQLTGEKITIRDRLTTMTYLARAKNEPVPLVLLYAILRLTKPDMIFNQVKAFDRQEDKWGNGVHMGFLHSDSPGNKAPAVSERKKLFRHVKGLLTPKPPLHSEEDAMALIKDVLDMGDLEISYTNPSGQNAVEKHHADVDEALVEAYVAANGLDWGDYPMLWMQEAVDFVRGTDWSFEQECAAFVECYQ